MSASESAGFAASRRGEADQVTLAVTGDIDLTTIERFREALSAAVASLSSSGGLTVDLRNVDFIGSAGIHALFNFVEGVRMRVLVSSNPTIRTLLKVTGLDTVTTVETDE